MRVARQERLPVEQTWAYHSWWSGATPQWNGPGPATPGGLAPHPYNNFLSVCISTFQSILHLFNSFCTQLLMNVSNTCQWIQNTMHMYSKENRWVDTHTQFNTIPMYTQRFPHCSLFPATFIIFNSTHNSAHMLRSLRLAPQCPAFS